MIPRDPINHAPSERCHDACIRVVELEKKFDAAEATIEQLKSEVAHAGLEADLRFQNLLNLAEMFAGKLPENPNEYQKGWFRGLTTFVAEMRKGDERL